ncbi:MAG: hypothetical protein ACQETC_01160 [Thermodesulfobacteriota bacterium]
MKITDPDVIKNGEKDLIEAVKEDIDWDAVKDVIREQMEITSLTAEGGGIRVHDNRIAFAIDFSASLKGTLMFDREGNYIAGEAHSVEHPETRGEDVPAKTGEDQGAEPSGDAYHDESRPLNEDIDDILKESREFWEKGEES